MKRVIESVACWLSSDIQLASLVLELLGPAPPQHQATLPLGHASPCQATILDLLLLP